MYSIIRIELEIQNKERHSSIVPTFIKT